nr:hypothetical protein [Methanosarcina thermophila]
MARGSELAVLPGGSDLAEHVFIEVAFSIAVFHRNIVQKVNYFGEKSRRGNGETGILHMVGVCRIIASKGAQEGKNMSVDHCEHLSRLKVLEAGPSHVFVGTALFVLTLRENAALHRAFKTDGFVLLQCVQVVQSS